MTFKLPPLLYKQNALEPHIAADVVKFHYGKHTKKYFEVASELAKGTVFEGKPLNEILTKGSVIKMDTALFNNASQAWNHAFYWQCLVPASESGNPSQSLSTAIDKQFQSFEAFKKEFTDKATKFFGSGWAWVVFKDGHIQIKTTPNAGNPLSETSSVPLLVCDLWEHAYYLQHPADRAAYITAWWNVVNWSFVSENFQEATK
jgi:Fe-Mn family superoxide dismutase